MADKTPRTDALMDKYVGADSYKLPAVYGILHEHARQLELENADLTAKLARAQAAVRDAADGRTLVFDCDHAQAIREAKEGKR